MARDIPDLLLVIVLMVAGVVGPVSIFAFADGYQLYGSAAFIGSVAVIAILGVLIERRKEVSD